jgi:hypothetical protein
VIRRPLIYLHRWLGILLGVLVLAWFVSGIVLMYAPMPEFTAGERLQRSPALDLSAAAIEPGDAAPGLDAVNRVRVGMAGDRPAYRLFADGRWFVIMADTGAFVEGMMPGGALSIARHFFPSAHQLEHLDVIADADQWTFSVRGLMPLHRMALNDGAGTEVYVSERTAEPVMVTTAANRRWGYAGAVVHWLYFTSFRRHAQVWSQSVIWLSIAGCTLAITGLVWGVWRYRLQPWYRLRRVPSRTPYAGWMRWHHYTGLFFGLTTLTWLFSGLLSMDPWNWSPGTAPTRAQREAVTGAPLRLDTITLDDLRAAIAHGSSAAPVKEIELLNFRGATYLRTDAGQLSRVGESASARAAAVPLTFERFSNEAMMEASRAAMPEAPIVEAAWLHEYDAYYYNRRGRLPLPVLRVRYDDPPQTWLYFDPARGAVVRKEERLSRLNRWLYHGLHSLDFPFLYYKRPLWDIVVIALSIGGIVLSATTIVPALRRLRRLARLRIPR